MPALVAQRMSLCIMHVCSFGSPALAKISAHISPRMTLSMQRIGHKEKILASPWNQPPELHRIPIYCLGLYTSRAYSCETLRQPRSPRVLRTERLHFLWQQNKTENKTQSCQSTKGLPFTYLLSRSLLGLFPPLAFRDASQSMRFLR